MATFDWLRHIFGPQKPARGEGAAAPKPPPRPSRPAPSIFDTAADEKLESAAGDFLTGKDEGRLSEEVLSRLGPNERAAREGTWVQLNSSNVDAIRYLWDEQILEVQFLSGAIYQFFRVPEKVFYGYIETPSPGRYHWNFIRDVYDYVRLPFAETKPTQPHPRNKNVVRIRRDVEEGLEKKRAVIPGRPNTTVAINPETGRWDVKEL